MDHTPRPLRVDAARNRARILEVAYTAFAEDGLSVSLDDIARRAGVGPGTVHRHFPAKDDLMRAVIEDRLTQLTDQGRALLANDPAEDALFDFVRTAVLRWGAADRGLSEALAGVGIDVATLLPHAEAAFLGVLGDLLRAAQKAGAVRQDIDVSQVKALLVGCEAIQAYRPDLAADVIDIALDGLRPLSRHM